MGFFEENPAVFLVAVIAIIEVWLRVRERLFSALRRRPADPPPPSP